MGIADSAFILSGFAPDQDVTSVNASVLSAGFRFHRKDPTDPNGSEFLLEGADYVIEALVSSKVGQTATPHNVSFRFAVCNPVPVVGIALDRALAVSISTGATASDNEQKRYDLRHVVERSTFSEFLMRDYLGRRNCLVEDFGWEPEYMKLTTPQFYKFLTAKARERRANTNRAGNS